MSMAAKDYFSLALLEARCWQSGTELTLLRWVSDNAKHLLPHAITLWVIVSGESVKRLLGVECRRFEF